MGLIENALLKAVRFKLSRDLGMDSLHPEYPESAEVIDEIIDWFRAHE